MLQTLDRGLETLEFVSRNVTGVTVAALAAHLGVHRAIAYRIVATLEARALIARPPGGRIRLGGAVAALAARFEPQLRAAAQPLLAALAQESGATSFLTVAQGEECVVIGVAEPERSAFRVGYQLGGRHSIRRGAAGIAILSGRPEQADDPAPVRRARRDGFSVTRGELQAGAVGVASPLHRPDARETAVEACVGVVAMNDLDVERAARLTSRCAARLALAD